MDNQAMDESIDSTKKDKVLSKENKCDTTNNDVVVSNNNTTSPNSNNQEEFESQWHIKDVALKELFLMKSVFKDFINGYYYDGMKVITEDKLEVNKQSDYLVADGIMKSVDRDVYMFIKNKDGEVIASVGVENQTKVDYKMSARVLGYDGASVRGQYDGPKSKMYCVNTIVINYSPTEWGETSLKNDIPKREGDDIFREKMVNIELNILNLKSLTPEKIKQYGNGELRLFFEIVYDIVFNKNAENHKVLTDILRDNKIVVTRPTILALAIKAVTKQDTYVKLVEFYKDKVDYKEGEQVKMCDVLKNYMESKDAEIAALSENVTMFVTYLINDNKSNEEIKKLVKDVTDDFINKIRESVDVQ